MKLLHTSSDPLFLELLKSKLEDSGIQSLVKNAKPPAAGEITPAVASPELWVMDDLQFPEAVKLLKEEFAQQETKLPAWKCPQCGEILEGQFSICWKCGCVRSLP